MSESYEVTTAEVVGMSSEALRRAVGRAKRVDECEAEIVLLKRMNGMLMDQVSEVKADLAKERDKKAVAGVAHENGRLEENPDDDELPLLRLENESLHTRQQVLEAQLGEAARYNGLVSEDLAKTMLELKSLRDLTHQLETKNESLQLELQQATDASISSLHASATTKHSLSAEAISKLQDRNTELEDNFQNLTEKYAKRKSEVTNLRANVTFLKSKINELSAKIQSNDAINDEALHRLKESLSSDALDLASAHPTPSNFQAALGADLNNHRETAPKGIAGLIDEEQVSLIENASTELANLVAASSSPASETSATFSLRNYFTTKLEALEARKSQIKPTDPSAPLVTITEHEPSSLPIRMSGSVQKPSSDGLAAAGTAPSMMNWHEYDAAFLVLSVMLLQKLSNANERLERKRREHSDLQEDFAEYKRSQAATPRSGTGSRKMSAETQQIALQKKITDLEKSVQSLTSAANGKEAQIGTLNKQVEQLTSEIAAQTSLLAQKSSDHEEVLKSLELKSQELTQLNTSETTLREKTVLLESNIAAITEKYESTHRDLESAKSSIQKMNEDLETKNSLIETQKADLARLQGDIQKFETEINCLKSDVSAKSDQLASTASELEKSEKNLSDLKSEFSKVEQQLADVTTKLSDSNDDCKSKDAKIALLEDDKAQMEQKTVKLSSELSACEQRVSDLSLEVSKLTGLSNEKMSQLAELTEKLAQTEESKLELSKSLSGRESELAQSKAQSSQLSNTIQSQSTRISELEVIQKTLEDELSLSRSQFDSKRDECKKLEEDLSRSRSDFNAKRDEGQKLTLEVGRLSSELNALTDRNHSLDGQLSEAKQSLERSSTENETRLKSISDLSSQVSAQTARIDELTNDIEARSGQISSLETQKRRLENELQMKNEEALEISRKMTAELLQVTAAKDAEIAALQKSLEVSNTEISEQKALIVQKEASLAQKQVELEEKLQIISNLEVDRSSRDARIASLETDISNLNTELNHSKESNAKLEQVRATTQEALEVSRVEVSQISSKLSDSEQLGAQLQSQVAQLTIKAKELEAYQKKIPEIADEALEAEERAVTKWLEYTLNKEKATSTNNPIAALASQLSLGTHSPGSAAAMHLSNGMVTRKITRLGDALRQPAILASVINLVKKDAFSEQAMKKMEEIEDGTEAENLRCLEECLTVARTHGLKLNGVTGQLLLQGNRRTLVDLALEVIRVNIMVRINVAAHPELSLLYIGKDETSIAKKHGERLLLKWVNTFIEDYNQSGGPARPLITNLGRDLSDGKALSIVLAAINPAWASLVDPSSALDLPRRIVKELAQAAFMRIIPPFLDSPLPILRGDETVLTILLAQLLEFNTGLSSPLSKDPVASSTSSTAYMLSATTPSRNQIRAVSGANMTESPMKTPLAPKPGVAGVAASGYSATTTPRHFSVSSSKDLASAKPDPNQVTIKAVEEKRTWKFW